MQPRQETLTCHIYTRVVNDTRFHAAIAATEATLPTEPLVYTFGDSPKPARLDDPGAWIRDKFLADDTGSISNANWQAFVRLFALPLLPDFVLEPEPQGKLVVDVPYTPEFTARMADLVRAVCPAAHAYWCHATPKTMSVRIKEGAGRKNPPPSAHSAPRSAAIPWRLGWINYWSDESCRLLDFSPDDSRAKLFTRVEPIEGHGVVLHLTEEPLDLDQPEHLAALTAAYDAFPAISQAHGP